MKVTPSAELLRRLLRYEPDTGKLFWLPRDPSLFKGSSTHSPERRAAAFNSRNAGKEAFTAKSLGRYVGRIYDQLFLAHRVIWAWHTGEWPKGEIDHINGDPADNRIVNLRDVDHTTNNQNMKRPRNNTSGCTGVSWVRQEQKWNAYIGDGKGRINLGRFASKDEAVAARKAAERELGYHPNHDREAA